VRAGLDLCELPNINPWKPSVLFAFSDTAGINILQDSLMREREADLTVLARSGRWQARPRPAVRTDLARSHLGLPGLAATAAPPEIQRTIPERCLNRLKQRRDPPPDTRSGLSFGVVPACGDGITVFLEGKFARIDVHAQRRSVSSSISRHSGTVSPHVRGTPVVSV
jgi:hypothetical protein